MNTAYLRQIIFQRNIYWVAYYYYIIVAEEVLKAAW
jgi:hypothetical protein